MKRNFIIVCLAKITDLTEKFPSTVNLYYFIMDISKIGFLLLSRLEKKKSNTTYFKMTNFIL